MAASAPRPALARGEPFARAADAPASLIDSLAARVQEDASGRLIAWQADAEPREASHGPLWERATRIAAGLRRQGVDEACVVVLLLPNVLDFVPALWACLRVGAIPLPFVGAAHSRSRLAALGERLDALGRPPLLVEDGFEPDGLPDAVGRHVRCLPLSALDAVAPDERLAAVAAKGVLAPTSGSTGRLKLAWLSPRVLLNRYLSRRLRGQPGSQVVVSPFPVDGISGLGVAFLGYRDWVQLPPGGVSAQPLALFEAVARYRADTVMLSSSMAQQILAAARASPRTWDLASLRSVLVGAEPVAADIMRELAAFLHQHGAGDCRIWAGYGATETGALVAGADPTAWTEADRGLLGKPLPGVSLRIVDAAGEVLNEGAEGEIEVSCPDKLFTGYWGEPGQIEPTAAGWWRTGDVGCLREGRLLVRGRRKEVFIHQGRKLALADIDVRLQEALGAEVRVIAVVLPEADGGQERLAVALAPLRPGAAPTDAATTIQATLARHFGARAAWIETLDLDQLPLTEAGKPRRADLARRLADASARATTVPTPIPESPTSVEAIWRELLGDEAVRQPQATFFELGGESLQSALLFSLIQERLGRTLPVEAFFADPTLDWLRQWASSASSSAPRKDREGAAPPDERPWPLPRELHQELLRYLENLQGVRSNPDQLVVGLNVGGRKPPLFWCGSNIKRDLPLLAKGLGVEQPLYGFRSLNALVNCTEDTLQQVALRYLHEIMDICPSGPLFLGGYCQGAPIMLAVAQHLLRRQRLVPLLVLLEWACPLQSYEGPVLFLYGRDSMPGNPFLRHPGPDQGLQRYFRQYWLEEIPGEHHPHHDSPEIFCECLSTYLERASRQAAWRIPRDIYPATLTASHLPARVQTVEPWRVEVLVQNRVDYAWSSAASGVWLGNYWMNAQGKGILTHADGRTECPELRPGASVTLPLMITAPSQPGLYRLVVDLVEEGSHWLDPWHRSALVKTVEVV
ncbi:MAG: AMP-binding protein [Methylococcus sp.]